MKIARVKDKKDCLQQTGVDYAAPGASIARQTAARAASDDPGRRDGDRTSKRAGCNVGLRLPWRKSFVRIRSIVASELLPVVAVMAQSAAGGWSTLTKAGGVAAVTAYLNPDVAAELGLKVLEAGSKVLARATNSLSRHGDAGRGPPGSDDAIAAALVALSKRVDHLVLSAGATPGDFR